MSEKEKQLASDILDIFERLPDPQKHRLVGVAEGMDMASQAAKDKKDSDTNGE